MCQLPLTANRYADVGQCATSPVRSGSGAAAAQSVSYAHRSAIGAQRFIPLSDVLRAEIVVAAGVVAALILGAPGWVGGLSVWPSP